MFYQMHYVLFRFQRQHTVTLPCELLLKQASTPDRYKFSKRMLAPPWLKSSLAFLLMKLLPTTRCYLTINVFWVIRIIMQIELELNFDLETKKGSPAISPVLNLF